MAARSMENESRAASGNRERFPEQGRVGGIPAGRTHIKGGFVAVASTRQHCPASRTQYQSKDALVFSILSPPGCILSFVAGSFGRHP